MIKLKYLVPFVFILILLIILLPGENDVPAKTSTHTETPRGPKVLTRNDSTLMHFDSLLTSLMDSSGTVGSATVITINGEVELLKCFGVKEAGSNDSIDPNTIFRLASVSKTITGVFAGVMSESNIIRLDDHVIDYLPGFRLKDSSNTYGLTIRNILSHTSGLVPHAYDNLVEAKVPFREIMDSLYRVNISDIPGKLYGYQNVIFSLYDTIVEAGTGQKFGKLLDEKLFGPVGMHDASIGFEPFKANDNKALPHGITRNGYTTLRLNDRYYNTNPAAGVNASITDMGQFMAALTSPDPHMVHPRAIDSVLKPQVISPLRWIYLRKWDRVESKHYGLGWRIIGYKGRQIAYHGGYVRGYRAEIAICREEGIGIAFLTNSPGRIGSSVVPLFLDMWFDSLSENENIVKNN